MVMGWAGGRGGGHASTSQERHRYASHFHWPRPIGCQGPRSGHWSVWREDPREDGGGERVGGLRNKGASGRSSVGLGLWQRAERRERGGF